MTIHKYHAAVEASKLANALNKYRKPKYHYVALKRCRWNRILDSEANRTVPTTTLVDPN